MKKLLPIFILTAVTISCDDEIGPVISDNIVLPALTSPAAGSSITMTREQAGQTAVFTWTAADFGVPLGVLYTLQASKQGDNFENPVDVVAVNALGDTMTYADFNAKMIALEAIMETSNTIDLRVMAFVPQSHADTVYSQPVALSVTPYTAKDHIYLVGQHNSWDNATAPVMNRNLPGLRYELYLNLPEEGQGFKILPTLGSWDGDIGEDPDNPGRLIAEGEQDLKVPAPGFYRISVDLQNMTWTALSTEWSLIGDFNDWSADVPMTYDDTENVLTGTVDFTAPGKFKFRANADWGLNLGDTGADGTLEEGGDDIEVTDAGSYRITLNLNPTGNPQAYTYTITRL